MCYYLIPVQLRFRYDPENEDNARQVARCCKQLLGSIVYYARVYATMDHFRMVEEMVIYDKITGRFYLSLQEYVAQCPVWCPEDCWCALAKESSHPDLKKNLRQIVRIATAINLSLTKEVPTLLQPYANSMSLYT
jgi:hypothetical protein